MADRGLGEGERSGQLADAHLATLMCPDQGYQPEPHRVREGLEHLRQPGGGALADRLADQRRGACLDNDLELSCGGELQSGPPRLHRHVSILTAIYPGWQAGVCIDVYR